MDIIEPLCGGEDQAKEEQRREIRKTAQQLGPREAQKLLPAGSLNEREKHFFS